MDRDKAFAVYAFALVICIASVITASVTAGFATLPSFLVFVEHLAMGLTIRFAYKCLGGFDLSDWTITGEPIARPVDVLEPATQPGLAADATSRA